MDRDWLRLIHVTFDSVSVSTHRSYLEYIGSMNAEENVAYDASIAKLRMDLPIKGFSYRINNRKWLLDANDISIIVCKDRSGELMYEDLMRAKI